MDDVSTEQSKGLKRKSTLQSIRASLRHRESVLFEAGKSWWHQLEWFWKSDQFNFLIDSVTFSEESRESIRVQTHTNVLSKVVGIAYLGYVLWVLIFTFREQGNVVEIEESQYLDPHTMPRLCFSDVRDYYTVEASKRHFHDWDFGAAYPDVPLNFTSDYIAFEDVLCIEDDQVIQGTFADADYQFIKVKFIPLAENQTDTPGVGFYEQYFDESKFTFQDSNKLYYSLLPDMQQNLEAFVDDKFVAVKKNYIAIQTQEVKGGLFNGESYTRVEPYEEGNSIFNVYLRSSTVEIRKEIRPYSLYDAFTDIGSVWTTVVFAALGVLFWMHEAPKAPKASKKLAVAAKDHLMAKTSRRESSGKGNSSSDNAAREISGKGEELNIGAMFVIGEGEEEKQEKILTTDLTPNSDIENDLPTEGTKRSFTRAATHRLSRQPTAFTRATRGHAPSGLQEGEHQWRRHTRAMSSRYVHPPEEAAAAAANGGPGGGGGADTGGAAKTLNAFELINQCGGMAITRMFQTGRERQIKRVYQFTTSLPVDALIEGMSKGLQDMGCEYKVFSKNNKVKAQKMTSSGMIGIVIQMYMMTPALHMVEIRRGKGDILEFYRVYCELVDGRARALLNVPEAMQFPTLADKAASLHRMVG
mmetsp:Transcript_3076/g.4952  ORF Transcript_3076/g.4952 Transcript_3076/m.4952 type:complete len:641 (-) Transcript_3076:903-2825(-)